MGVVIYCYACLVTDVRMFAMSPTARKIYNELVAIQDNLSIKPKYACYECAYLLRKYAKFKTKCCKAYSFLQNFIAGSSEVTVGNLESVDRTENKLESKLTTSCITINYYLPVKLNKCVALDKKINTGKVKAPVDISKEQEIDNDVYLRIEIQQTNNETANGDQHLNIDQEFSSENVETECHETQQCRNVNDIQSVNILEVNCPDYNSKTDWDGNVNVENIKSELEVESAPGYDIPDGELSDYKLDIVSYRNELNELNPLTDYNVELDSNSDIDELIDILDKYPASDGSSISYLGSKDRKAKRYVKKKWKSDISTNEKHKGDVNKKTFCIRDQATLEKVLNRKLNQLTSLGEPPTTEVSRNLGDTSLSEEQIKTHKKERKRKKNEESWKRNALKTLRNTGKQYTTTKHKIVEPRSIKSPCGTKCRHKCYEKITADQRQEIFDAYWKLGELYAQRSYVKSCISDINPRYKYTSSCKPRKCNLAFHFIVEGKSIRVCKTFFIRTLDISERVIRTVRNKTDKHGVLARDLRGLHKNDTKKNRITKKADNPNYNVNCYFKDEHHQHTSNEEQIQTSSVSSLSLSSYLESLTEISDTGYCILNQATEENVSVNKSEHEHIDESSTSEMSRNEEDSSLSEEEIDHNKKGRKRKRNEESWKCNRIKTLRNTGKQYTTSKDRIVEPRSVKLPCDAKCRLKCYENITAEQRQIIFDTYWYLGEVNSQRSFINSCTSDINPRYKYTNACHPRKCNKAFHFTVDGKSIRVCKTFFTRTLDISERVIRTVRNKTDENGILAKDQRGRHNNHVRVSEALLADIKQYIEAIPRIAYHYVRQTSAREYIDGGKSISDLYRDFRELQSKNNKRAGTYSTFYKIFKEDYNISFVRQKNIKRKRKTQGLLENKC